MPEILRPDGAVLQYEATGAGEALLALAPGGVSSARDRWRYSPLPALEPFEACCRIISMDQRHAGASRANLTPFSYDDALADQLAVLDREGIDAAHVLGVGVGAACALKLAYDAPARVRRVCLVHPVGVDDSNRLGDHYQVFNETIRVARAEGLEGVIAAARKNGCFVDNPAGGPWAARLHDEPAFRDALRSLGREMYIALVVDFRDAMFPPERQIFSINDVALSRIRAPLLVAGGSSICAPASVARAIAAKAQRAEYVGPEVSGSALVEKIRSFFSAGAAAGDRQQEHTQREEPAT